MTFTPRPSQLHILQYTGGKAGVSAVPGSGKTQMLSALAAQIITDGRLLPNQEVLIVTLVNSAVDNFAARVADFLEGGGLLQQLGYRVRTLHGLAHDIVREDPPSVGLEQEFSILDETASLVLIREAADAWVEAHPDFSDLYLHTALDDFQRAKVETRDWPEYVESIAASFIRSAKDRRLSPDDLRRALANQPYPLPLAGMGLQIYSEYQRALSYRGAVDFDDLILLAYQMLESSPELLARLRYRWPFILEDEAQDSSRLQQQIISKLVGEDGNWIRVGDPNQAIFETFTTAEPALLREFMEQNPKVDMPETGRCQPSIMALANHLIDWVMNEHPAPEARDALSPPYMQPAPQGDPQPNPPDDPSAIRLISTRNDPDGEIKAVVDSIQAWLPGHPESTVAVLSCTNDYAAQVAEELRGRKIEYRELLRSTSPTRAVAGALSYVLDYLATPDSAAKLSQAYRVWRRDWREDLANRPLYDYVSASLRRLRNVEAYLAPLVPVAPAPVMEEQDLELDAESREAQIELGAFRDVILRWHAATVLPIDQLVLALSQEIFTTASDVALAHKLAIVLRQLADENPDWRLPEFTPSLNEIARNERRFMGFSSDDIGFNPDDYRGIVVVSTMHKAKGLEWDRVYMVSLNNYDYPSNQPDDRYIGEKWFLRDGLNLEAEALAQLDAASQAGEEEYEEGAATRRARLDYVRERLRLLYVGITRARRELLMSWNTGRRGDATPAVAFTALQHWQQEKRL